VKVISDFSEVFSYDDTPASMFDGGPFAGDSEFPLSLNIEVALPSIPIDYFFIGVHDLTLMAPKRITATSGLCMSMYVFF